MSLDVSDTVPRVHYVATALQTIFAVPFEFETSETLAVYVNGVLATYADPPASAAEFSTTGEATTGGGTIIFGGVGRALNDKVVIINAVPIERLSDYPTAGRFPVAELNADLDRYTMHLLQVDHRQKHRSLTLQEWDGPEIMDPLPLLADRANKLLSFDADGQPVGTDSIPAIDTAVAASAASAAASAASASASATSATNSSTSATNASTSATNASTSDTNASNSAAAAATSATNAGNSATAAAGSATAAAASAASVDTATLLARANHTGTQLASTISNFAAIVRSSALTGLSLATSTAVTAADSFLVAIGKLQAQVTLRATLASPDLTGTPTAPTAAVGTNTTQLATTAHVFAATREKLTANRTYYVRTDGSDSNTGLVDSAGGAWLTLANAMAVIATIDFAGFVVTVQIGDGTYTGGAIIPKTVGQTAESSFVIRGNSGTPANVLISVTAANCFLAQNKAACVVQDLEMRTTTSGDCIFTDTHAYIGFSNVIFGAAASDHITAIGGAKVQALGNYTINGAAVRHGIAVDGGYIVVQSRTVTITGTPAFSGQFLSVLRNAQGVFEGNTYSGSATGVRYSATLNAVISVAGAGASALPGNAAGSTATGGQYA